MREKGRSDWGAPFIHPVSPGWILLVYLLHTAVRINDELPRCAFVKIGVALRCLIQRNHRDVDGFGDLDFIVQNRLH